MNEDDGWVKTEHNKEIYFFKHNKISHSILSREDIDKDKKVELMIAKGLMKKEKL